MDYKGIIRGAGAPPKYKKKFIEKIFKPYDQYEEGRTLLRCQDCRELIWKDSPNEVFERHAGHRFKEAIGGTFWEWCKIKLGLIR